MRLNFINLANREKASLAFQSVVNGDRQMGKDIFSSVPMHKYDGLDDEFTHHYYAIEWAALLWGNLFWREYARYGLCPAENEATSKELEHRLVALLLLGDELVSKLGVHPDSFYKLSEFSETQAKSFLSQITDSAETLTLSMLTDEAVEYHDEILSLFNQRFFDWATN